MKAYLEHWLEVLHTSFWFVPPLFASAALVLAFVSMWVDSAVSSCDSELLS